MTEIVNLDSVAEGFSRPPEDAQTAYRSILRGLSRPGEAVVIDGHAGLEGLEPAAASILLTLLDFDTALFLAPEFQSGPVTNWVRFHTGCQITDDLREADFALFASAPSGDDFSKAKQGEPKYPDQSATFIVQVPSLQGGTSVSLQGPGINGSIAVGIDGLNSTFWNAWRLNTSQFPLGIDVMVCSGSQLIGLPRTSRQQADA